MGFKEDVRSVPFARSLAAAVLLIASVSFAQGTSVLTGTVTDAATKQPVADVVVTATSPALQGEQIVVTDSSGLYRIPQLPPGTYTLRLEKEAYRPYSRGDIVLRVDRTIRVNIELLPEALKSEEIVVVGKAPTIDVSSTTTGVNVGSDFVRNIAVVRPGAKDSASRSFESLAEVAPGANADQFGVSVNGTTSPENQFVIDGLSVNDPGYGIIGTPLTIDFIQEVNVITGGYMPEYGRATGGVMNVVTKSGGNEFHGSVFGNWAPGALSAAPKEVKRAGSVFRNEPRLWNLGDFGAELGGPILKDKLWFYAGFAPSFSRTRVKRSLHSIRYPTDANGRPILVDENGDPTQPLVDENGFTITDEIPGTTSYRFADIRTFQYIGKLTYLLNQDHNLSLSVYGAPSSSGGGESYGVDPQDGTVEIGRTTGGAIDFLAHKYVAESRDIALKWSSSFLDKHFLVDVVAGWHHQLGGRMPRDGSRVGSDQGLAGKPSVIFRRTRPHSILEFEELPEGTVCELDRDANGNFPNAKLCPATNYGLGGPDFINEAELDRYQAKATATYLFQALGHHVAKVGIDFENMVYLNRKAYSGTYRLRESTGGGSFTDHRMYGYFRGPDDFVVQPFQEARSTSNTIGGFIQDSWNVADLFTINAGVRWDQQTLIGDDKQVGLVLGNQVSPRVGVIYDFTQQGRSKIFANFARYYESVPLDLVDRQFPGERQGGHVRSRAPAGGGPGCDPLKDFNQTQNECLDERNYLHLGLPTDPTQFAFVTGGDKSPVDPELKPQSSEEIVAGGEYEVIPDGRVGLQYTKRWMKDVIEDMSRDEASTYFIGNPGSGIASDFPKAQRDYDAVTVYFSKAFSDLWLAQASYTYASLRGNYAGLFRPETGQLDPNINTDFDLISLVQNRYGPLPGDRTHQIKLFGAKEFVLSSATSLNLGLTWRSRSGEPTSYWASHNVYGADEVFVLPRGSGPRMPWVHVADGHLGFTYRVTKDNAVTLSADLFNLLNFQAVTAVDERYTNADVNPIPDGTAKDICYGDAEAGCQTKLKYADGTDFDLADVNPNFRNPTQYQAPFTVRFGAKVSF